MIYAESNLKRGAWYLVNGQKHWEILGGGVIVWCHLGRYKKDAVAAL